MKNIAAYEIEDYYDIGSYLKHRGHVNKKGAGDEASQWNNYLGFLDEEGQLIDSDLLTEDQFIDLIQDSYDLESENLRSILEKFKKFTHN
jgi:hypothetical protein